MLHTLIYLSLLAIFVALLAGCTPRGIGIKAELYGIDERQESSATHASKGLRCFWYDCGSEVPK